MFNDEITDSISILSGSIFEPRELPTCEELEVTGCSAPNIQNAQVWPCGLLFCYFTPSQAGSWNGKGGKMKRKEGREGRSHENMKYQGKMGAGEENGN